MDSSVNPAPDIVNDVGSSLGTPGTSSTGLSSSPPAATEESITVTIGKRAPNFLTFLRIAAVPFFVFLMVDPSPQSNLWATLVFLFAAVTDWLDGYLARLFQAESILGKLLDPLADKILVMAALVMLAAVPAASRVPAWIVVVLLSREMLITGLRSLAAVKGIIVPASDSAKHKTAWTFIAIVFLLIDEPYRLFGFLVDFHFAGMCFLWIALFLAVTSALSYWITLRSVFSEEKD